LDIKNPAGSRRSSVDTLDAIRGAAYPSLSACLLTRRN
jgi:hypothetical protein